MASFSEALDALKKGRTAHRAEWEAHHFSTADASVTVVVLRRVRIGPEESLRTALQSLFILIVGRAVPMHWAPTEDDIMAEDWVIDPA